MTEGRYQKLNVTTATALLIFHAGAIAALSLQQTLSLSNSGNDNGNNDITVLDYLLLEELLKKL